MLADTLLGHKPASNVFSFFLLLPRTLAFDACSIASSVAAPTTTPCGSMGPCSYSRYNRTSINVREGLRAAAARACAYDKRAQLFLFLFIPGVCAP